MAKQQLMIKVCGMRDLENISSLSALPIDYIGHIFYPKSKRYVSEQTDLGNPGSLKRTGVFVNARLEEILRLQVLHQLQTIQLHGEEPASLVKALKQEGLEVIKAFGIEASFDWQTLEPYLEESDYLLFDSKSDSYGGTGQAFQWEKLLSYPYEKAYFLSGGLSLANLAEAVQFPDHRLQGLDLNSKFEIQPGIKDIEKIKEALKIIQHEQISSK